MPSQLEEPAPRPRLCDPAGVSCRRLRRKNSGVRPLLVPAHGRHLGARGLAHLPVPQLEVVRGSRRARGMPLAGSLHSPCFSLCSSLLLPGCMACGRTSGLLRALCIQYLYVLLLSLSCCLWLHGSLANKELGVLRAQLHGHVAMPCPPWTAHFRAENCMASSPARSCFCSPLEGDLCARHQVTAGASRTQHKSGTTSKIRITGRLITVQLSRLQILNLVLFVAVAVLAWVCGGTGLCIRSHCRQYSHFASHDMLRV